MKKSVVGLLVLGDVPGIGKVALLQRRGEFNHERMGLESWPGGCQVTAFGSVKENEIPMRALYREIKEELGGWTRHVIEYYLRNPLLNQKPLDLLLEKVSEEKSIKIWGLDLSLEKEFPTERILKNIQFGPSSGGLVLLPENRVGDIADLTKFDKKEGVTDRRVVAMFPDEKEAVRRAFEKFK